MKQWLRQWLGITEIQEDQALLNKHLRDVQLVLTVTQGQAIAANRGMCRLIAKLDPLYGKDELDPARKAASDKISDEIIHRLISEHVESNKLTGHNNV